MLMPSCPTSALRARPVPPLLLLVALTGCARGPETAHGAAKPAAETPPLVRAEPIELRQVRREIETTAFLESEHRVSVLAKVSGRVDEVLVDEGDLVEVGQILARLDDREAAAAVRQAEVQLQAQKVRRDLLSLEIEAALSRIQTARIERDRTKAEFERNRDMQEGFVSQKVLDESKFAFESAQQALQVAEFNHRKAELDVRACEAQIQDLEAKLVIAQIGQQDHRIQAPLRGRISARWIKGGETISLATELFTVVDTENLVAYLSRPQRELPVLQQAKEVRFRTDAFPEQEFVAAIDMISPVVDQATGSFRLRMRVLREEANLLRPGMFVRARILTESLREALMVPKAALLAEGETMIVFAIRDGIARRVLLQPGLEERLAVECTNRGPDGLREGDLVATGGHEDLRDKQQVELAQGGK